MPITGSMTMASCLTYLSILIHFQNFSERALFFSVMHYCTKTDAGDKVTYYRLSKNIMRQQENSSKAIKNTGKRQLE